MIFTRFLPLVLLVTSACSSTTQGSSGSTPSLAIATSSSPKAIVTAPLPIPSSASTIIVGSEVPPDAPVTDVPAPNALSFQALARGNKSSADQALGEGDTAYRNLDFVGAQKAYEKAATLAPKDPAPIVGIVRSRLSAEQAPVDIAGAPKHPGLLRAVDDLEKAVRLDERYAPARLELGRTFLVLGRMDEAQAVLRKAIDLAPQDAETHSAFGVSLLATGIVETAVRELEIAAGLESSSAIRFKNWGTALFAAGKTQEAVRAFERAAQLAPADARIQNDLGTGLLTLGETDRALEHLFAAVKRNPKKATYRSNLGYGFAQRGELDRAILIYREALALDPKLGSAWINLGNALAKQRKFQEARAAYDQAEALDPTDPRVKAVIEELRAIEQSTAAPRTQ